jgi:hypothetical protein
VPLPELADVLELLEPHAARAKAPVSAIRTFTCGLTFLIDMSWPHLQMLTASRTHRGRWLMQLCCRHPGARSPSRSVRCMKALL